MSNSFRAVKEVWGEHSSNFIDSDIVCRVFDRLADDIESGSSQNDYGDKIVVWISDGKGLLAYLRRMKIDTRARLAAELAEEYETTAEDMGNLIGNLCSLSHVWYEMLDTDGSIRFYVD